MRLAFSAIAWDAPEDAAAAELLQSHGVDAVDLVASKYFERSGEASEADALRIRQWWADRGFEVTGMQALMYGTSGLNLFGPREVQEAMLAHLGHICRIGGTLGATRLVFGSPGNRNRNGLSDLEADEISVAFFRRLGDVAATHGVFICLEPNPPRYNCNFMTTTAETADVVRRVSHPAIRLQLDTGAMAINQEDPAQAVANYADLVGHVHASEPGLMPVGDGDAAHGVFAEALRERLPAAVVSIEMLASRDEPHLVSMSRALREAARFYRDEARPGSHVP